MQETHFETMFRSDFILFGRSGSRSSGREREISSIFVRFSTVSIVSGLRKPPTTITGQDTTSAIFAAGETKYPSLTCARIPLTEVPLPLTSIESIPA